MRNNDGSINYLLGDHLGSVSTVVNASGEIISQSRYLPFGELLWSDGDSPTDYTYTGSPQTGAGRSLSDIGLMDYNARFYDPMLGRFTSPDSIIPDPGSVIGYNRFAYVANNPMIYTDPSGHRLCEDEDCREPGPSVNAGTIIDTSINLYNNITNIGWLNSLLQKSGPWYTNTKNTIDAYDAYKNGDRRPLVLSLHAQGKVDDVINWLEGGITLSKASSIVYYTPDASKTDRWLAATYIGIFYAKTALAVYGGYRGAKAFFTSPKIFPSLYKSRGSTGRTVPNNLTEQLMMEEVKSDPLRDATKPEMSSPMGDGRWSAEDGWVKMQVHDESRGITIHFNWNEIYVNWFDDFKFVFPK